MSTITLFQLNDQKAFPIQVKGGHVEKWLQTIVENNLDAFLAVRFLASEYPTTKAQAGRIDTLGIDENGFPVIIEYKRTIDENVINQGLYYLDWLLDHRAEFQQLVSKALTKTDVAKIDWSGPRLICIAATFTKFDEYAVKQIDRNIDLVRYQRFGENLLALEALYTKNASGAAAKPHKKDGKNGAKGTQRPSQQSSKVINPLMKALLDSLREYILTLGDDIGEHQKKHYVAFRRIKNFTCVVVRKGALSLYVKVNPDDVTLENGFTRDMREKGHFGTGYLEITIHNAEDLQKAIPLIKKAYENI